MKNEEKYFSVSQVRALLAHRSGAPDATLCAIWAPWELLKKVPLSGYLNGFGLAVSWTRLGRVRLSRIRNLCLKGTPSTGRKSLVTLRPSLGDLRPSLGVKRSKKGARVHQKGTRLNGKRDVPRSETMGRRAPRFEILAPQGPLARGPEAQGRRTSGKKAPRPRVPRLWWLARGGPTSHRVEFRGPGTFLKNPTCHLFEWVRPSGFVDTARKGPIEPNS